MSVINKIRKEILENYLFSEDESELNNDESFLEYGIIDSTGVLELIFFLEEEFSIEVKDREMIPENLDSVTNLVNYLKAKGIE